MILQIVAVVLRFLPRREISVHDEPFPGHDIGPQDVVRKECIDDELHRRRLQRDGHEQDREIDDAKS